MRESQIARLKHWNLKSIRAGNPRIVAVPESPSTVCFFLPLQPIQSQMVPKETLLLETELGFIYRLRKGLFRLCNEPRCFTAVAKWTVCRPGSPVSLEEELYPANRGPQSLSRSYKCD